MNPIESVKSVYSRYADFSGRAPRSEFWWFWLFFWVALFVSLVFIHPAIGGIFALASILPAVAVFVRRLHDVNRTAWWLMLYFVPFGGVVLFFFLISSSEELTNKYGPNPKMKRDNASSDFSTQATDHCTKCGLQLPIGGDFCIGCGNRF